MWGEHFHHGYYSSPSYSDHKKAQTDMIDKCIEWGYGSQSEPVPKSIIDVGCGVGGSSRYLAKKFGMKRGAGISLSPFQISVANELTKQANLSSVLTYSVADALAMPFQNSSFDLGAFFLHHFAIAFQNQISLCCSLVHGVW